MRILYIDAAKSLLTGSGKKIWKCSIIENDKNVANFVNSKAEWSIEAEAYALLVAIFWLLKQNYSLPVTIYSDCRPVVQKFNNLQKSSLTSIKKALQELSSIKKKTKFSHHLLLSKKITLENKLQVTVKWVAGKDNPADSYSRNR
jgi:ribonuclease HI